MAGSAAAGYFRGALTVATGAVFWILFELGKAGRRMEDGGWGPHSTSNVQVASEAVLLGKLKMGERDTSPSARLAPPMRRNTPSVWTWPNVEWFRFCGDEPSPPRLTKRLEEVQRGVVLGFIDTCPGAGACLFSGA
jgi:hypothetical protein